ncbi:MAG TPA: phosphatase PAP2 family protein [Ramlibacter sp.]|uniref:phosphatase PAP2 family protein n=1 Tax=Ramlibacter sp. TaxID=1917967 RepID=UPI002C3485F9|nr:phosphatase PAP2 family protein [Ramlibacter sp.]HVZ44669.1 phosphatase PAP2 family protein [Ramlibacter sp.]
MIVLKTRQIERVALALSIAVATIVFTMWPGLDVKVAGLFFDGNGFAGDRWLWSRAIYRSMPWLGWLLGAWAAVSLFAPRLLGPRGLRARRRRGAMLLLAGVVGVGLVVHVALKDHWGRPRPGSIEAFGGPMPFQQALAPSSYCPRNCSFVSGHAAGGFVLLAIGVFGARRKRLRWLAIGMAAGFVVGAARMAQGGHFLSDIVFCALIMWATAVLLRECWLRAAVVARSRHRRAQSVAP